MHIYGSAIDFWCNQTIKKIQRSLNHRKVLHRLGIDAFTYTGITEVASLLYLRNFVILQDSCDVDRGVNEGRNDNSG
jgi:hypothetical protein